MNFKEIQDLIKLVNKMNLAEFKMKDGEFEVAIRTSKFNKAKENVIHTTAAPMVHPVMAAPPVAVASPAPAAAPAAAVEPADDNAGLLEVRSPIVGTFYRSASPDKPPYIKIGDSISEGSVVCIVEAMKLFNEIESEVAGKVVKVLTEDASPVEYDQVLFLVDPKG